MRRIVIIATLVSVAAAIALVVGATAQGSDSYTFDVVFDDARGLIGGQLVKIAGAKAGTINNVTVTKAEGGYKALINATITGPFQFHTDASCTIRPEGLIAENYVNCDPGTAGTPLLQGVHGQPPTVSVSHTTEPVSLLDLFNIFNVPTRERFQVLVDELGIATAGRGDDINAILQRANPALKLADQVIGILDRQKDELATIIDASSTIAAQGASHTAALQSFISRAASLASLTANHASNLSLTIQRLPALLDAAEPALSQLDTVAKDGTPLLSDIRQAVPYIDRVNDDLGPFTKVAKPALSQIGAAITAAIPAVRAATPLVTTIRHYIKLSEPNTALFAKLAVNLEKSGFAENFFSLVYYVTASLARYDATSHLLSILLVGPDNGLCGTYATTPVPACSAHYGTSTAYVPPKRAHRSAHGTTTPATTTTTPATTTTTPTTTTSTTPSGVTSGLGTTVSSLPGTTTTTVHQTAAALQSLVNYLLK
jgi:ABC-type transporter Mla subunit MlaD